jgi:valyl-tRNA synthetase
MSAHHSLGLALSTLQRLFAPFLPFVADEVWSWWQPGSVHRAVWPDAAELRAAAGPDADAGLCALAGEVLGAVRKAKSDVKASMRTDVTVARVVDTDARLALLASVAEDVRDAGRIADLVVAPGEGLAVEVELAVAEGAEAAGGA